jgi:arginyl-tRNA synthetase
MAQTPAENQLVESLSSLGLSSPLKPFPNCHPEVNPVDIYRAHITELLTDVTGVEASIIYPALQWTLTLEKGDLVLPVPALRVKGKKPVDLAIEWAEKVSKSPTRNIDPHDSDT